jgi:4-hydroxy-3-methylbut-2-enyl diphosphate reductase IspH
VERPEAPKRNKDIGHESPRTEKARQIQPAWAAMVGFIAVAAGAFLPNVAQGISTIFSKMSSLLLKATTA